MRVRFFTKAGDTMASSRQRAFLVAEELRKRGVDAAVLGPSVEAMSLAPRPERPKLIREAWRNLTSLGRDDVLFLHRTVYNKFFFLFVTFLRVFRRRRTVFDLDDAVYLHTPFKTDAMARMADLVTAGSRAIEVWAKERNRNVLYLPTSLQMEKFAPHRRAFSGKPEPLTLGWSGNGPAHLDAGYLPMLKPVFEELLRRKVDFTFVLLGAFGDRRVHDFFAAIPGLKAEIVDRLAPEDVPARLRTFTLGLMPLDDTPWSRAKCALKALEYMAVGVPAVVSDVGENREVVRDGQNGFLATTAERWADAIESVARHPERLPAMSRAAIETVQARHTFDANIPRLIEAMRFET